MSLVRIHCYGCQQSVLVDEHATAHGLALAGWALNAGETFCPACAAQRGHTVADGLELAGERVGEGREPSGELEPFPVVPIGNESRLSRSWRLPRASFSVLRCDPQLLIFPAVAMGLNLILGVIGLLLLLSGAHTDTVGASHNARGTVFIASLIAAYPLTFISLYCGVALAAVLAGRLEGQSVSTRDGWIAARQRLGIIAAWSLLVCTVGALLRVLEERLPLGGRIVAALVGLSWSLATLFAVPVLAYENLGPLETLRRSSQIFRRRWGAQIGGSIGIGALGALVSVPLVVLIMIGLASPGAGGALIVVLAGMGLFAVFAANVALEQIYRVFVYRSAVGLDTASGPFTQRDLQTPFKARRRRF
jgi:hypothetical protein